MNRLHTLLPPPPPPQEKKQPTHALKPMPQQHKHKQMLKLPRPLLLRLNKVPKEPPLLWLQPMLPWKPLPISCLM
jgi:hypothetical protein